MRERPLYIAHVVCLLIMVWLARPAAANLVPYNGDFSFNLDGWSVVSGNVTNGGGYAKFEEHSTAILSTLKQEFTLPEGVLWLAFDVKMSATPGGDDDPFAWPDAITASLLDPVTLVPLISNPGRTDFFYMDNTNSLITIGTLTITADLTGFGNRAVALYFDLIGSDDGMLTTARVDNVEVGVPEPCSLLLLLVGSWAVGPLRRTKMAGRSV